MSVICPYCGAHAKYFATSEAFYNGRDYGPLWACIPCDAQVGTHPDGNPLGTLADKPLRDARIAVKYLFNPLWLEVSAAYPEATTRVGFLRKLMRTRAYEWLGAHMDLDSEKCHVAMFDLAQCERAVLILRRLKPTAAGIRAWAHARKTAVKQ